uniref:Uncharacterized protein n=1 Tax=Geospiza parvula TaxID=87175 RepID=A0A8U8BVH9_GEOPR
MRPSFTGLVDELERVLATLDGEHYVNLTVTYTNLDWGPAFPPAPPGAPMEFPASWLLKSLIKTQLYFFPG